MTAREHLQAAFAALVRGDLEERDRQCDLAKAALDREPYERAGEKFYAYGLPLMAAARKALKRSGAAE